MIERLNACPVCKHKEDIHYYKEGLARKDDTDFWFIGDTVSYCIECEYCGHYVEGITRERAIKKWNEGEISEWEKEHIEELRNG